MGRTAEWIPIGPGALEELPELPGVFVVGSLVRNVLLVGSASEGIRAAVRAALDRPELRGQARSLKVEPSDDPPGRMAEILSAYRDAHDGALPPAQPLGNPGDSAEERRPPLRVGGPRPGPSRYTEPTPAPVLVRIRSVG